MAPQKEAPLFKLPAEITQRLKDQGPEIEKLRKMIVSLKEMGMDTKALEDQLELMSKQREVLLRDFV